MNSTIYIQAKNNFPFNIEAAGVLLEMRERGADIKLFETDDIESVPLNRGSVIIGSIENTHRFFTGMGWNIPPSITIPDKLSSTWWTRRNITKMTLGEALIKTDYPFFIKSYELKKFTTGVIESDDTKKWFREDLDRNIPVLVSDVVDFKSEWRVYVLNKQVVGVCNYLGDLQYYPEMNIIEDMIRQFDTSPSFYSLDVAVMTEGRLEFTALIECNDGYSLGNYGLPPKLYTRGLMARWMEILKQNPVI